MEETDARLDDGRRVNEDRDSVFRALSAAPRRRLVASLVDVPPGEGVPLPESATAPVGSTEPARLRRELHHCHLPMLSELGFVDWEAEPFVAIRGPKFGDVAAVVEAVRGAPEDGRADAGIDRVGRN